MRFKRLTLAGVLLFAGWAWILIQVLQENQLKKGLFNVAMLTLCIGGLWFLFCAGLAILIDRFKHMFKN